MDTSVRSFARFAIGMAGLATSAQAQPFSVNWYTIDGGGITAPLTGGAFALVGTAGQADAGSASAGAFRCDGGFWGVTLGACYANCDGSTTPPVLNVLDFACFLNAFAAQNPYANCDGSTAAPALNVLDFACFLNAFAAGCS